MAGRPISHDESVAKYNEEFRAHCKTLHGKEFTKHFEDEYKEYPKNKRYTDSFLQKTKWLAYTRTFGNSKNVIKYEDEFIKFLQENYNKDNEWDNYLENRCDPGINNHFPANERYARNYVGKSIKSNTNTQKCRDEIAKLNHNFQKIFLINRDIRLFFDHFVCDGCPEVMRSKTDHQCSKSNQV